MLMQTNKQKQTPIQAKLKVRDIAETFFKTLRFMEAPGIGTLNCTEGVDIELVPDGRRKIFCVPRHHAENKNQSENDKMSKKHFFCF